MSIVTLCFDFVNFETETETAEECRPTELLDNDQPAEPDWDALAEEAHALDVVCSGYSWL